MKYTGWCMNAGTADGQANAERLAASELSAAAKERREEREQLRTAVAAASHRLPPKV